MREDILLSLEYNDLTARQAQRCLLWMIHWMNSFTIWSSGRAVKWSLFCAAWKRKATS